MRNGQRLPHLYLAPFSAHTKKTTATMQRCANAEAVASGTVLLFQPFHNRLISVSNPPDFDTLLIHFCHAGRCPAFSAGYLPIPAQRRL